MNTTNYDFRLDHRSPEEFKSNIKHYSDREQQVFAIWNAFHFNKKIIYKFDKNHNQVNEGYQSGKPDIFGIQNFNIILDKFDVITKGQYNSIELKISWANKVTFKEHCLDGFKPNCVWLAVFGTDLIKKTAQIENISRNTKFFFLQKSDVENYKKISEYKEFDKNFGYNHTFWLAANKIYNNYKVFNLF